MENVKVKRGVGRPRFRSDEDRKAYKTNYMLTTEWYCDICGNSKNYKLAGKWTHIKAKKHKTNEKIFNLTQKLEQQTDNKINTSQLMQQIINLCKLL